MTRITLEQAIRNAIEVELSAARFYEELAGNAADVSTRVFFEELQQEELGHARAIEALGRDLTDGRLPDVASEHWEIVETSPAWRHVDGTTYGQALEVALESERGAALFYAALANAAASKVVRSFFDGLSQAETVHVRQILARIESP
jgi:rubrerythrin